jgi:hypothetical protein
MENKASSEAIGRGVSRTVGSAAQVKRWDSRSVLTPGSDPLSPASSSGLALLTKTSPEKTYKGLPCHL